MNSLRCIRKWFQQLSKVMKIYWFISKLVLTGWGNSLNEEKSASDVHIRTQCDISNIARELKFIDISNISLHNLLLEWYESHPFGPMAVSINSFYYLHQLRLWNVAGPARRIDPAVAAAAAQQQQQWWLPAIRGEEWEGLSCQLCINIQTGIIAYLIRDKYG